MLRGAGQTLSGLSGALETIYRSPARVALSAVLHLGAWIGNGAAVWLGFRLIGTRIDLPAVIAIESIVYAIRSVAVIIPNALGVQEGAYILLAPLFGLGTDTALAISVLKPGKQNALQALTRGELARTAQLNAFVAGPVAAARITPTDETEKAAQPKAVGMESKTSQSQPLAKAEMNRLIEKAASDNNLDPNLIRALFLARDNARSILGFTSADGTIGFIDY